jgi:type IV pilus assembly protein PilZ
MAGLGGPRNGILSLTIRDKAVLYAAYMPFVQNGGLFIPVAGKVVWITPKGAQGNRAAGIGVQFSGEDDSATKKIETYLAGSIESDRPTHTM